MQPLLPFFSVWCKQYRRLLWYSKKRESLSHCVVHQMVLQAVNVYLIDGAARSWRHHLSQCFLRIVKYEGCLLCCVALTLLLRHGVSGGSDRGPGESAAGPRRGPGSHHHLLMMGRISNWRQHPDIIYSVYFTHDSQSGCWNVDFWMQKKFILFL